jgi:hypothetical protein
LILNFVHESGVVVSSSFEVNPLLGVGALGLSCRSIDGVLEAVCITKEVVVSDCTIVVSIDFSDESDFFF